MKQSLSESEAISEAWRTRNVFVLCLYYFAFRLKLSQIKIVSIVAFDGFWFTDSQGNVVWKKAKKGSICCATRYGKSRCVALGCLLWIMCNPGKRLRLIAPKEEKTSIIREYMIEHIINNEHLIWLLDIDRSGRDRIKKAVNRKRMTWRNGVDFRTLTADKAGKGEGLMGWGGDKIVVEEAGEIPAIIWPKIQRMMLDNPDASYCEIGNPWDRDGFFWQHWIDESYEHVHIDWRIGVEEGRYTLEQIEEIRRDPMVPPMMFQILYDAVFPEESEDQLIPYVKIQKAIREIPTNLQAPDDRRLGADIAEFGSDLTVLTAGYRHGTLKVVRDIKHYSKQETMETVDQILTLDNDYKSVDRIVGDATGLGAGVVSRLKQLKNEGIIRAKVIAFKAAESPTTSAMEKIYKNQKAQAYFYLRSVFIDENIIIPNNRVLIDQLTKMKWKRGNDGKMIVLDPGEGKDDTAEKKSPDFADSLCYFNWDQEKRVIISSV